MNCPVCKSSEFAETDLHVEGFYESLFECKVCNSTWSVNHGVTEVVKDTQAKSFLEGLSESVEGDDYNAATGTAR